MILSVRRRKHEAFGLVNVEAMASGLPVIGSQIGGIPEIVQHERNGLLVQNFRDPSAFAAHSVRLAQDSNLRGRLSKQAREDALSRFNWKLKAAKLMDIYQQARK